MLDKFMDGQQKVQKDTTSQQEKTWTVPADKKWVVHTAYGKDSTRNAYMSAYVSDGTTEVIIFGGSQVVSGSTTVRGVEFPLYLRSGWTIKTRIDGYAALDTVEHSIYYSETPE